MIFNDRHHAGELLSNELTIYQKQKDVIVLALPRGGVPVGFKIAKALQLSLDVFIVRKLGVPWQEELAFGAIAEGDVCIFNEEVIAMAGLDKTAIDSVIAKEKIELRRRQQLYRNKKKPLVISDRVVILVDDGLATGATMRAAILAVKQQKPKRLIVAVPVGSPDVCALIRDEHHADEIICLQMPPSLMSVGMWYRDFSQTSDAEVKLLLKMANKK